MAVRFSMRSWVWKLAGAGALAMVVVGLLLWLGGTFDEKIAAVGPSTTKTAALDPAQLVAVRKIRRPRTESSVGTIRSVHEAAVASKLLAKVVDVRVTAGQHVEEGALLVQLDDRDLRARLEQAQAAAAGARAARTQAQTEFDRVKRLHEQGAAAQIEWDRVQTALQSATAELDRAEQAVAETQTILEFAEIRSPISGLVIDKKVEVGDTATPGQVVLTLLDPTRMQLVASVREALARRLAVGQTVDVRIDALGKTCQGRIHEIVPEAQAASRSFSVKVTGPCPPGMYSGMFGRLLVPLEDEELLVVPRDAVRRIGQLDIVQVVANGAAERRAVALGREIDSAFEILAGLREGEQVLLPGDGAHGP